MNEGNDYQRKKALIVKQIFIVNILRNDLWTVWRICILIVGRKDLALKILPFHSKNSKLYVYPLPPNRNERNHYYFFVEGANS